MRYFFVLLALLASLMFAQETPRLEQIQQRLQLTDTQRDSIRPILLDEVGKVRDIRAKYDGQVSRRSQLKMLRELRDVQKRVEEQITPLLTKQQRDEWKKIRQERRDELRTQRQ
jgi:Na+-transporting NADH:ubiquinone oxidoreductase subunit NqrC